MSDISRSRSSDRYSWDLIVWIIECDIAHWKIQWANITDFSREISVGIARERKNTRLRTSQLSRAPPRWLWKFRKDLTRPNDLTFPLTRIILYFSFPHLSYEKRITGKGILVCRPNRLHVPKNVIKTKRCCKMRHSCVASSSFLLCYRDYRFIDSRVLSSFRFRRKRIFWYSAQIIYRDKQQVYSVISVSAIKSKRRTFFTMCRT